MIRDRVSVRANSFFRLSRRIATRSLRNMAVVVVVAMVVVARASIKHLHQRIIPYLIPSKLSMAFLIILKKEPLN